MAMTAPVLFRITKCNRNCVFFKSYFRFRFPFTSRFPCTSCCSSPELPSPYPALPLNKLPIPFNHLICGFDSPLSPLPVPHFLLLLFPGCPPLTPVSPYSERHLCWWMDNYLIYYVTWRIWTNQSQATIFNWSIVCVVRYWSFLIVFFPFFLQ